MIVRPRSAQPVDSPQRAALPVCALLGVADGTFWLPPPDSTTAGGVDNLFYFILWISTFFFVLIVVLMIAFVIVYRRRPGVEVSPSPNHNTALELTWSVIPVAIVVVIFYRGFTAYLDMRLPPREACEINVVAQKWSWLFKYHTGFVHEDLHVPAGQSVRLIMRSEDVIHSLSIPDFRVKMDVVPGRYTKTWFHAPKPGMHDLLCTEYCGTGHSQMLATVVVHRPGEFELWLRDAEKFSADMTPADRGAILYRRHGCQGCHTIDGSAKTGPSFLGIYGEMHRFADGTELEVEENYIRESILDPSAKVREGYKDQMNSYQGTLDDEQIADLIQFIKSLKTSEGDSP